MTVPGAPAAPDTDLSLFRVYYDPAEIASYPEKYRGYPFAWFEQTQAAVQNGLPNDGPILNDPIKDIVRDQAGHRCIRCGHRYDKGDGEWSRCDVLCTHPGPVRYRDAGLGEEDSWRHIDLDGSRAGDLIMDTGPGGIEMVRWEVDARWRILTVHHLNGVKHDCRWWNLVSLCQVCHLVIQAKVHMQRPYHREHSEWFKPYVAGFYASVYAGLELTRAETMLRLEELLALEHRQLELG